jgi:hypothetical protein
MTAPLALAAATSLLPALTTGRARDHYLLRARLCGGAGGGRRRSTNSSPTMIAVK